MRYRVVLPATVSFLLLAAGCSDGGPDPGAAKPMTTTGAPSGQVLPSGGDAVHYEDARAFIEYNAGDKDLGFHAEFGAKPWATVTITDPDGNVVFDLAGGGSLTQQGLATVFFESGEYGLREVPRNEFLARFPEGEYTFVGRTLNGKTLTDTWAFTHLIPDAPSIASPAEDATVDRRAVTIDWKPVTRPAGVDVEVYQLEVFPVDPPKGKPPIDLNIDYILEVPPTVTEVTIPPEILMPREDYEFELTVVDKGGNQTFAVGTFTTSG